MMNDAQDHKQLPAGTTGARPSYLGAERASWLAVSWRGLVLATLLFACLAVLVDFVL
ncbi:MAG TPA: hypothetical protein VGU20_05540 [Stellaceae bacterium]|nr:hypothetical protein [Stellaceae bacterium]